MQFKLVDTQGIYRRLLAEPDAAARETIFRDELVEPFAGLTKVFGSSDPLASFASWGMPLTLFAEPQREHTRLVVEQLGAANAWARTEQGLQKGLAAFAPYADRIPLESITFGLMVADMSGAPWAGGYTGFGGVPGWIMTVYGDPSEQNLRCVEAATVHELHHNLAGAAGMVFQNMMTVTVGEYMVGEGLAESFAAELYGEDTVGPWVTQFDDANLEHTKAIFREGLNQTGFNLIRSYIFGGLIAERDGLPKVDVPLYAGYALGYRVVQAYMKRTGKKVVETTFMPAQEIIEESGFFA